MFIHESISELLDTCLPHRNFDKVTQALEASQKSIDQNDEVRNKGVVHYEEKLKEYRSKGTVQRPLSRREKLHY